MFAVNPVHLHFHLNRCETHPLLAEDYSDRTSPGAPYFELFEPGATAGSIVCTIAVPPL